MSKPCSMTGAISGCGGVMDCSVDARTKYADAERVLYQIRQSGLQNVSLITEKPLTKTLAVKQKGRPEPRTAPFD